MIKNPLKHELNAFRLNKSHKRVRKDTCAKCHELLDGEYEDYVAIKVTCPKCGVLYERKA